MFVISLMSEFRHSFMTESYHITYILNGACSITNTIVTEPCPLHDGASDVFHRLLMGADLVTLLGAFGRARNYGHKIW